MLLALLIRSGLYYSSAHLFKRAGVARLEYCERFFRKIRDAYSVILCQRSHNVHRAYLAIEEFNGG